MVSYPTAGGDRRLLPIRRAFGAGAAGWVLGYVATAALVLVDGGTEGATSLREVGGPLGFLDAVGVLLLEAQFATTDVRIGAHEGSVRLLPQVAGTIPEPVYHLAPAVALVAVAAIFVRAVPFRPASPEVGAALGAGVVVGYLPLTLAAVTVFAVTTPEATLSTAATHRLVYPGLVYPTTAGLLGGALAWHGGEAGG